MGRYKSGPIRNRLKRIEILKSQFYIHINPDKNKLRLIVYALDILITFLIDSDMILSTFHIFPIPILAL